MKDTSAVVARKSQVLSDVNRSVIAGNEFLLAPKRE
jgi:hypothetical protein